MAVTHGMDVGEVRRLGGSLQSKADQLDRLVRDVDRGVGGSSWVGPDATRFKTQWWPEHKAQLLRASQDLHGLGQSALNDADEQDRASGVGRDGKVLGLATWMPKHRSWTLAEFFAIMAVFFRKWLETHSPGESSDIPIAEPGDGPAAGEVGASSGELSNSHRSWEEVQKVYEADSPGMRGMGKHAYGGNDGYDYQCTSWAKYRWRELGYEGDFGTSDGGRTGKGWEMAGFNSGSVDTPPSLGAMASYGDGGEGSYGHVMIVEEVSATADGLPRIRVSEMNVGTRNYEVGRPEEFRDENWFVQQPNGSWSREGGSAVGEVRFATFPGST